MRFRGSGQEIRRRDNHGKDRLPYEREPVFAFTENLEILFREVLTE